MSDGDGKFAECTAESKADSVRSPSNGFFVPRQRRDLISPTQPGGAKATRYPPPCIARLPCYGTAVGANAKRAFVHSAVV